jgi:hypothetical protein
MEETMRAMTDADVAAIRNTFDSVLAALPQDRLRTLVLELMFAPLTTTAHCKPGRPRRGVEGENVVPLHRKRRRRGRPAVDAAKLAERRKRAAASRKAARHAAKAAKATKGTTVPTGNGEDMPVTAADLWRHAEKLQPTRPWMAVVRELGVKDIHAQAAYRNQSLPPHVGAMAITKFLTLPVAN